MNRHGWLMSVLIFLLIILGWFWFWFLRYACDDDWCLILESRKIDLATERSSKDVVNIERLRNTNTTNTNGNNENTNVNTNTNVGANVNGSGNQNSNTSTQRDANIQITEPRANQLVSSPLTLSGKAREFENVFNYRVRDADGAVLGEDRYLYSAPDAGVFGEFRFFVEFDTPRGNHGTVEVFALSPRDGSEIDMVTIPVQFE